MVAAYILVIFLFFYAKLEAQVWAKAGQGTHQGKQQQMLNKKKKVGTAVCGCAGIRSRTLLLGGATPVALEYAKTWLGLPRVCGVRGTREARSSVNADSTVWVQQSGLIGLEVLEGRSREESRGAFDRG